MSKVVGIDLGTTFSSIAVVNPHGKPEIIPNREGERLTLSVVLFDSDTPIVGSIAKCSAPPPSMGRNRRYLRNLP
jgi:molecular chaperone DnaK